MLPPLDEDDLREEEDDQENENHLGVHLRVSGVLLVHSVKKKHPCFVSCGYCLLLSQKENHGIDGMYVVPKETMVLMACM